MRNFKRVMAFGLAAVLSLSTLAGCGGSSSTEETAEETRESLGTVTMASYTTWDTAAIMYQSGVSINRTLNGLLYERLIWQKMQHGMMENLLQQMIMYLQQKYVHIQIVQRHMTLHIQD